MRKLLLNEYDLKTVINGLYQMRGRFSSETNYQIESILLNLIGFLEERGNFRPTKKRKTFIQPADYSLIIQCLVDWRNQMLKGGDTVKAEVISELIINLT